MGVDELIAARRTYGRIDEHDGEYVETEFRCLGWLRIPLVPVRSFWIADDRGNQRTGFPIKLQPRSVAATYLRIWAPGIAIAVLVVGRHGMTGSGRPVKPSGGPIPALHSGWDRWLQASGELLSMAKSKTCRSSAAPSGGSVTWPPRQPTAMFSC